MQWTEICKLPKGYKPSSAPRLLLTGSNGLLGQAVLRAAASNNTNWTIIASSRDHPRGPSREVPYVDVDIASDTAFRQVLDVVSPSYVLHTAAMTQVDLCEEQKKNAYRCNLSALETLLSSVPSDCFVVQLSTDFVFDGTKSPYAEDATLQPCNYYGITKQLAEERLLSAKLPWAIVRTSMVYGMGEELRRPPLLSWVRSALKQDQQLKMVNDQWRRPTFVDDLALACLRILSNKCRGIFHITGEECFTPYEMVRNAARHWGYDEKLVQLTDTTTLNQRANRPPETLLLLERTKKKLNYQPRSFAQALRDMDNLYTK